VRTTRAATTNNTDFDLDTKKPPFLNPYHAPAPRRLLASAIGVAARRVPD
jgi:hypothetical protein